jgi:mRNA interferase HigB
MRVIGRDKIVAFQEKHPTSAKALNRLLKILENADCSNPAQLKKLFGVNVDFVGKQTVLDAGGNKVRVITKIQYGVKVVLITHVLDHKEYDKAKWKE